MSNNVKSTDLNAAMSNLSDEPIGPSGQVEQPVQRATVNQDGTVTGASFQKNIQSSTANKPTGSAIFSVIRDGLGNRLHVTDIKSDSIVTLDSGAQMQLHQALAAGFVTKRADGSYAVGNGEAPQEKQEVHPDLQVEALSEAEEAAVTELTQGGAAASDQLAILDDIAKGKEINEHTLNRAASSMSIEPHQLAEKIDRVVVSFQQQAESSISDIGVDPQDVWAWAWEQKPRDLERAMKDQGTLGTTRGYQAIGQAYISSMDQHSPDSLLEAEIGDGLKSIHRDHSGRIVLTAKNGKTITWAAAVAAGLVKVSKARKR